MGNCTSSEYRTAVQSINVPGAQVTDVLIKTFDITPPGSSITVPICDVNVRLTHPGDNDNVLVSTWLPDSKFWNGRYQATGGGGWVTGGGANALSPQVNLGYAASQTDGGHNDTGPPTWAFTAPGQLNEGLWLNFASRSLHDMAVVGKAVTTLFYGKPANYSYWNGCSTGGRQGYMEAQKYPDDFDGILANAPAINWPQFMPAEQWGQVVMQQTNTYLTECEFKNFRAAAIAACDNIDKVVDGVIGDPNLCQFDPFDLVGQKFDACTDISRTITTQMANVIQKIEEGPRAPDGRFLWYGLDWGTDYFPLDITTVNGTTITGNPFFFGDQWIKYFVLGNPDADTSNLTIAEFAQVFDESVQRYEDVIGTNNPDLSAFRDSGGKLLTWHGQVDQIIFADGTIDYRKKVEARLGGANSVDEFYRLFLAPGVGHCGGDAGPSPVDPLSALVAWVEQGRVPDTLFARTTNPQGQTVTRNLCRYPLVSRYQGGDQNSADSYVCATSF